MVHCSPEEFSQLPRREMVSDQQVRRVLSLRQTEKTKVTAADKAGMDAKTARKYARIGKLPSEVQSPHTWRTRKDPFAAVWEALRVRLVESEGRLEAKTLFEYLQREQPGVFDDGLLRTLQRRIKQWRALDGPSREVFFPQIHRPGVLCQSDFTHMGSLEVTIGGGWFDHLIYHLVLPYSNWETGTICFSESFESLSEGLQNGLWKLGGVPESHQTDRLTSAVNKTTHPEEFTARYHALLRQYDLKGKKTNRHSPHENGDVEQRNYRFKRTVEQALLMRGSRDFSTREEYAGFLEILFERMNKNRSRRFAEELSVLHGLPERRLESCKREHLRVGPSSTIRVNHNTYSVNSRMIGEMVKTRLYMEHLEVYYGAQRVETLPRLRGEGGYHIEYRHIIEWLVRKPGAFENYRYREELFPTHRFRMAYDRITEKCSGIAIAKSYLAVLYLAFQEGESLVDRALESLLETQGEITEASLREELSRGTIMHLSHRDVTVAPVDLSLYDMLLESAQVSA
jgi:hypothetical protein